MASASGEISLREALANEADVATGEAAKLRRALAAERKRSAILAGHLESHRAARARRGAQGRLAARATAPPRRPVADPTIGLTTTLTPAEARHDALRVGTGAARAATAATGERWLVVPAHEHATPALHAVLDEGDGCREMPQQRLVRVIQNVYYFVFHILEQQ